MIYLQIFITLSVLVVPAPAPVPRCSPFIFINKLAEWTNVWSDSNPYFPVPPCEHGGPLEALARGDLQSVFVTAQPLKISLHNFYEFVWLLKTGIPRMLRILAGNEPFIHDSKILSEGYQHYTPSTRTTQIGHSTQRRPEIIDNFKTYKAIVSDKIDKLAREGPDRHSTAFTPLGNLPARSVVEPQYILADTTEPGPSLQLPLHQRQYDQNPSHQYQKQPFNLMSIPNQYHRVYANLPRKLHPQYNKFK